MALIVVLAAAHLGAAVAVAKRAEIASSRRVLAVALVACMPLVGVALAVAVLRMVGRGDSPALTEPFVRGADHSFRRLLADDAPLADKLVGTPAERRSALAQLVRGGDAHAIAALRWLVNRGESEAVVEAALALEELTERRMKAMRDVEARVTNDASWQETLAAADGIADMIHTRLADQAAVSSLASSARGLYSLAAERAAPKRPAILSAHWAMLELAASQPEAALAIIDRSDEVLDARLRARLQALRDDAAFACRVETAAPVGAVI